MTPLTSPDSVIPARTPTLPAPGRVLVALDEAEYPLFFPGGLENDALQFLFFSREPGADSLFETLRSHATEVVVTSWSTPKFLEAWLEELPELRYICHTTGSIRQMIPRAYLERGIQVTNWGAIAASTVAEHALLLTLAGLRRLPDWAGVIAGKSPWHPAPVNTQTLYGKRVGLHGFGNVARALVALLRPFGAEVQAFSTGVPRELYDRHEVTPCTSLEALFSTSDILVECEALNPHTRGIVDRTLLEHLPAGALFVNVARGALVDEAALADLAQSGRLRLALDVYETDPIGKHSPLHRVKSAVLSPHIAGPTVDQYPRCGQLVARNLRAFFAGEPLEAEVTLAMYDRAT